MIKLLLALGKDARGGTAIEYGFLMAIVFLGLLTAVTSFADESGKMWASIAEKSAEATSTSD